MADDELKTATFLQWLAEAGVKMHPSVKLISLAHEGRGRGVGMSLPSD
jgi:hypothetical protein